MHKLTLLLTISSLCILTDCNVRSLPSQTNGLIVRSPYLSLVKSCFIRISDDTVLYNRNAACSKYVDSMRILDVPCIGTDYGVQYPPSRPMFLGTVPITLSALAITRDTAHSPLRLPDVFEALHVAPSVQWWPEDSMLRASINVIYGQSKRAYRDQWDFTDRALYFFQASRDSILLSVSDFGISAGCPFDPDSLRADIAEGYWIAPDFRPKYRPVGENKVGVIRPKPTRTQRPHH